MMRMTMTSSLVVRIAATLASSCVRDTHSRYSIPSLAAMSIASELHAMMQIIIIAGLTCYDERKRQTEQMQPKMALLMVDWCNIIPVSTTFPSSMTTTRSQSRMVRMRWAIIITVHDRNLQIQRCCFVAHFESSLAAKITTEVRGLPPGGYTTFLCRFRY